MLDIIEQVTEVVADSATPIELHVEAKNMPAFISLLEFAAHKSKCTCVRVGMPERVSLSYSVTIRVRDKESPFVSSTLTLRERVYHMHNLLADVDTSLKILPSLEMSSLIEVSIHQKHLVLELVLDIIEPVMEFAANPRELLCGCGEHSSLHLLVRVQASRKIGERFAFPRHIAT